MFAGRRSMRRSFPRISCRHSATDLTAAPLQRGTESAELESMLSSDLGQTLGNGSGHGTGGSFQPGRPAAAVAGSGRDRRERGGRGVGTALAGGAPEFGRELVVGSSHQPPLSQARVAIPGVGRRRNSARPAWRCSPSSARITRIARATTASSSNEESTFSCRSMTIEADRGLLVDQGRKLLFARILHDRPV